MKEKFKEFVKEIIPSVNTVSEVFEKVDMESGTLTITLMKDGYIAISPDYKLGMEVTRINKDSAYDLKTRELLD